MFTKERKTKTISDVIFELFVYSSLFAIAVVSLYTAYAIFGTWSLLVVPAVLLFLVS